ncbi:MAG: hypothetical protein AAGJ93_11965 [Bacteroidota bacterium]
MNLRLQLTILLLGCLVSGAHAQMDDIPAQLSWGSTQKAPNGSRLAKIITAGNWGASVLRYQPGGGFSREAYWLEHFDARMALKGRYELELPQRPRADLEDIISLGGQLYILLSRPTTEGDASRVYARPLSSSAQVTGSEILLADLPRDEKFRRRQFDLEYSRDSSTFLLYNQLPPQKGGPEEFTLRVFDDRFQLLWSRDVVLPYRDRGFNVLAYKVDPEGNVFLLGRQKAEANGKKLAPMFTLFSYTSQGREEIEYKITLDDIDIHSLRFEVAGNGDVVCGGLYAPEGKKESQGICHIRINPLTREAYQIDLVPFPIDFLAETQHIKGLEAFRLRDLTLRSDGGIVVVAEQYYWQRAAITTARGYDQGDATVYNDIVVANLAPDGTYSWLRNIPKKQETFDDQGVFSSFVQATVKDRFYFLFNDNRNNFQPDKSRIYNFDRHESVIKLSEINRAGEQTTVPLFVNEDAGIMALPRRCRQVGARTILIYGEKGREYRLGLLRLGN